MDPQVPADDPRALLDELRAATERRIGSLRDSFDSIVEASSDENTDDEHDPEGHTIAWERQQIAALIDEAKAKLTEIAAAEQRLGDGQYGTCATCGHGIGAERLRALPAVSTCIRCAR